MGETENKIELVQAIKEMSTFINKLCGHSLEQIGGMAGDYLGYLRLKRLIQIKNRVEFVLNENDIEPSKIDLKILIPALNYSSLEDNEKMQEKWAALLANSSNFERSKGIKPIFVEILNQLTPKEVSILDCIYEKACKEFSPGHRVNSYKIGFYDLRNEFNLNNEDYNIIVNNLSRLSILETYKLSGKNVIKLTHLGFAFIKSCRFN